MRKRLKKFCYILLYCLVGVLLFFVAFLAGVKYSYPLSNSLNIEKYSFEYELCPNLIRAVIKVESAGNSLATSNKGAVGLMQIMPETAEWIARELDIVNFKTSMLYEPELNIEFGCFYLNYLFQKYTDLDKVLFAYNAGEGNLLKALNASGVLELENIEICETRAYIFKVQKALKVYEKLLK